MLDRHMLENAIRGISMDEKFPGAKRVGKGFMMKCPFHDDSTPSMSVSEEGMFHCFGCGVKGDYISFLMMLNGRSFTEAVREIERMSGITLLNGNGSSGNGTAEKILHLAADFYYECLNGETLAYLSGRGISEESIEKFRIGYAPGGLRKYLFSCGYSMHDTQKAGLLDSRGKDFFYKRIMIPITTSGKVVGFAGRSCGEEKPKYKNSPETSLFKKSTLLFALDKIDERATEDGLILVEGYFDAIALHQAGFNAVGIMGTSPLTDQQISQIRRKTDKVYICLDGDPAGRKAAVENAVLLLKHGIQSLVVDLPCDPDEYLLKGGDIEKVLQKAVPAEVLIFRDKNISSKKKKEIAHFVASRPYYCSVSVLPLIDDKDRKAFSELSARALLESMKDRMSTITHFCLMDRTEIEVKKAANHIVIYENGRFLISRALRQGVDINNYAAYLIKSIYLEV